MIDINLLDVWGRVQDWWERGGFAGYRGPELPTSPILQYRWLEERQRGGQRPI